MRRIAATTLFGKACQLIGSTTHVLDISSMESNRGVYGSFPEKSMAPAWSIAYCYTHCLRQACLASASASYLHARTERVPSITTSAASYQHVISIFAFLLHHPATQFQRSRSWEYLEINSSSNGSAQSSLSEGFCEADHEEYSTMAPTFPQQRIRFVLVPSHSK